MINQVKPGVSALLRCHVPGEKCADVYGASLMGLCASSSRLSVGKGQDVCSDGEWPHGDRGSVAIWDGEPAFV